MSFEKKYTNLNASALLVEGKEFEQCVFSNCDFSNANLSGFKFIETKFENCNLSLAKLANTSFQEVAFVNCKLSGLIFDNCKDFGLAICFENCVMDYTSFVKKKLPKTKFEACSLKESIFESCDLSNATFSNCDLLDATFTENNLSNSDFSEARNFLIDPERNQLKKAKFSNSDLQGLLAKYEIVVV